MKTEVLEAKYREEIGRNKIKGLKKEGMIPSIIYGNKSTPIPITLEQKELLKVYQNSAFGRNTLISFKIKNGSKVSEETVISHIVTLHPVSKQIIHVDFLKIDLKKEITAEAPLRLEGTSAGQKLGGILIQNTRTVTVSCLPTDIPEYIEVDISQIEVGESITVGDLDTNDTFKVLTDPTGMVVHVEAPKVEQESTDDEDGAEEGETAEGADGTATEGAAAAEGASG